MYLVHAYDDALYNILHYGEVKFNERTNIQTLSIPGIRSEYDLRTGRIPAISRRKLNHYAVVSELLWFLKGYSDNLSLQSLGCNYWTPWVDHEWARSHGFISESFGPVYGFQLRHFGGYFADGNPTNLRYGEGGFDQLVNMINIINSDPSSRQNLWSLWHPPTLHLQRLPPCHLVYRVSVNMQTQELTGIMYQRSCDFPVGVPANILFYSLLTIMLAHQTGYRPRRLVHITDDSHIYENQIDGVKDYLGSPMIASPKYDIIFNESITDYAVYDFYIDKTEAPNIKFPVAV
jgi:thymidylate synthase